MDVNQFFFWQEGKQGVIIAKKSGTSLADWQLDGLARSRVLSYTHNIRITLQVSNRFCVGCFAKVFFLSGVNIVASFVLKSRRTLTFSSSVCVLPHDCIGQEMSSQPVSLIIFVTFYDVVENDLNVTSEGSVIIGFSLATRIWCLD